MSAEVTDMEASYRPPEGFLTMTQTQERLRVSKATAQKIVREAALPLYRDPRNKRVRLFKETDIECLLQPVLADDQQVKTRAA
jgi:hypothetical protein